MIDLEVRNFQSVEHAKLQINGFTALVGKSNIGKSALVRAVKSALTGSVGTSFVRHTDSCARRLKKVKTCECYCSVHISTEGFDLLWEKGDKRNRYVFNGKEFGVPNRGTPDFLERPLMAQDFGMVKVGDNWKILQVSDQFENIFLLDQTGGAVADVFSDVARLDRVNVAIRFVEKDRKEAVSTRKVREADCAELKRRLTDYDGLDGEIYRVAQIEKQLEGVSSSNDRLNLVTNYIEELRAIGYRVDLLEAAVQQPVPVITTVSDKHSQYETVSRFATFLSDRAASVRSLSGIDAVPEPSVGPTVEASRRYFQLAVWSSRLTAFQEVFHRYKGLTDVVVPDVAPLREVGVKNGQLNVLSNKFEVLSRSIAKLEKDLSDVTAEEAVLLKERESFAGYCPACAQPIVAEHKHEKRVA